MIYTLIGDLHGADLIAFCGELEKRGTDALICTGDFDQTSTIHQYMDLEAKLKAAGKEVITVPGNHDQAILTGLDILSGTLDSQGKTSHQLHRELMDDKTATDYLDNLCDPEKLFRNGIRMCLDKDRLGRQYPALILHGALAGDISCYYDCPFQIATLWMRQIYRHDFRRNLSEMKAEGLKVMIKGHDHEPVYACSHPTKGTIIFSPLPNISEYRLYRLMSHTINPGALYDGYFATIDTGVSAGRKAPVLRYHRI